MRFAAKRMAKRLIILTSQGVRRESLAVIVAGANAEAKKALDRELKKAGILQGIDFFLETISDESPAPRPQMVRQAFEVITGGADG